MISDQTSSALLMKSKSWQIKCMCWLMWQWWTFNLISQALRNDQLKGQTYRLACCLHFWLATTRDKPWICLQKMFYLQVTKTTRNGDLCATKPKSHTQISHDIKKHARKLSGLSWQVNRYNSIENDEFWHGLKMGEKDTHGNSYFKIIWWNVKKMTRWSNQF